jgi:hypothetical protein
MRASTSRQIDSRVTDRCDDARRTATMITRDVDVDVMIDRCRLNCPKGSGVAGIRVPNPAKFFNANFLFLQPLRQ